MPPGSGRVGQNGDMLENLKHGFEFAGIQAIRSALLEKGAAEFDGGLKSSRYHC